MAGQIEKANVLLIVTHRPEWQSASGMHGNVNQLTLSRLNRDEAAELTLLARTSPGRLGFIVERIIDESDAIPLFVEELARGVMVEGSLSIRHGADDPNAELSASRSD